MRHVDLTPTWREALNMCRMVIENGTDEGKQMAWEELGRMAELADKLVQLEKKAAEAVTRKEIEE